MSCQVQNSWTTPSDWGTFKTINQIQTDPVQEAMALSRRQFHDVSRLSPVQIPQVTTCPFSASDGKENTIYFTLDAAVQARQTFDFSAFNRLITDMGSLNVTGPITNIHPPEASFYSGDKLLTPYTDTDGNPDSSPHSSLSYSQHLHSLAFSAPSEYDTKPVTRYLTLHGTTRHDSCIDRTTQTISQTSEDDTVPNFLQAEFAGRDKTQREKTQGG
ncbi:LOW QUALITY PROTEIN: homeobox protein Hox-B10a [Triplophysa dalaica]|uniref:LOW QUALITY PROTEIN: homeobox protein Hox-B10a n=1 Tax=Triplophysa dalaica TaxID=1582913 RepID=UPI0024E03806|nr:LOW QUALITY PROTEIN: homeobox protein Hox-B10a [Triplophysa dalaica]